LHPNRERKRQARAHDQGLELKLGLERAGVVVVFGAFIDSSLAKKSYPFDEVKDSALEKMQTHLLTRLQLF